MTELEKNEQLQAALLRRATGYMAEDEVEEYAYDSMSGAERLAKRKVSRYQVPPDMSAIKLLLEVRERDEIEELTEEQFETERKRLILLYQSLFGKNKKTRGE